MAEKIPQLPSLLQRKIYKTGQTRGADDDVIYQNRVNRNSTVLIPYQVYSSCNVAPDNNGNFENSFIVLIKPEDFFDSNIVRNTLNDLGLEIGINALLFYETREQWNTYNPERKGLRIANARYGNLGGSYVARVPSTTSANDEKISHGFNTSGMKGAGVRVYEYASSAIMEKCRIQLEYLYWCCYDSDKVSLQNGMSEVNQNKRKDYVFRKVEEFGLGNLTALKDSRIVNNSGNTICPLCLKKLSSSGFFNRLEQAEGRDVPDLTVTQLNLFHIHELRYGEFNHKPYNLGWGHHHCNVVTKDSGIDDTLSWMYEVIIRNWLKGFKIKITWLEPDWH